VRRVHSVSSLFALMSTIKDLYVRLHHAGTSSFLMNLMVLVPLTPHLRPYAKCSISFSVDLIHRILYLNNVMSSWCFKYLPVSGQLTVLAISGMMMTGLFVGASNTGVTEGPMGK
jgi:hypothetical protein